jgi:hypothetical protein
MAIDQLSYLIYLPIDNICGSPPPEDSPDEETLYPQKPDLTCTPDSTKMGPNRQVVAVENAGGGKHLAKKLDCTTSIASIQKNGIHGIHSRQHTTFNRLNYLASKPKCG